MPWFRALKREFAERRVRISAVSPGALRTDATESAHLREDAPDGAFITPSPDDIATAVAFIVTRPPSVSVSEVTIDVTANALQRH
jgi:NADP-dependent 3-hydroxy acid dehydrogenase YdfG